MLLTHNRYGYKMAHMDTVDERHEVRPRWKEILYRQGRTLTWLAKETDRSYPVVAQWSIGARKPPDSWLDKVSELLGEDVRS